MGLRKGATWRLFKPGRDAAPLTPALPYLLLYIAALAVSHWNSVAHGTVLIWPANGVLAAALLLLDRRPAQLTLGVCFLLNLTENVLRGDETHMVLTGAVLNGGEAMLTALIARRVCGASLDLRRPRRLARFVFLAAAPPALGAAVLGIAALRVPLAEFGLSVQTWFTVDILGLIIVTPTLLLLAQRSRLQSGAPAPHWEKALLMGALAVVSAAVFAQSAAPVLFLIFLPLLLIAFRLPPAWSAMAVLVVAAIGGTATLNGFGPVLLSRVGPSTWDDPALIPLLNAMPVFQAFMIAVLCVSLPASTVLTERRRLEARLKARTDAANAARLRAEEAELRVTHLAHHDGDTNLLNRTGLEHEISEAIGAAGDRLLYVAALGIDRFSAIRTAIGAAEASALMERAARRLRRQPWIGEVGLLASGTLGATLIASDAEEARVRLAEACAAFAEPVTSGRSRIDVRLTSGLAAYPEHAADARRLTECAQIALDQAGAANTPSALFDGAAEAAAAGGLTLLSELRAGLNSGAVWLAHQPKLHLRSGAVESVECLIRWSHPSRGPIPPDQFIPLVEETGFIEPLTDWVLRRALAEQKMLLRTGVALAIAVNISARSLSDPGFAARVRGIVAAEQASAEFVTLEITETAIMTRPDVALRNLAELKSAGFGIAVDDYGTGLSSLAYLRRIPADELKIDRSFISNLGRSKEDAVLVKSTIDLGHSLGLKVVAEGVEDQAALDLLTLFGCDHAQGYYLGPPVPALELATIEALKPPPTLRKIA